MPKCRNNPSYGISIFKPISPVYRNIQLVPEQDTAHFYLPPEIKNNIKAFNFFISSKGIPHISFYDHSSEYIAIYQFADRKFIKGINLRTIINSSSLYKISSFVQNFDSIYITNYEKVYLIDSGGKKKKSINFNDAETVAYYTSTVPMVIRNNEIVMGARLDMDETLLSDIKEWKVLCIFDLQKQLEISNYPLPQLYHNGLYGKRLMEYSYCYNNKGNFVFSFAADANIYETNLGGYHIAYYAKSCHQNDLISAISKETLGNKKLLAKEYSLRDSYGAIYYDPYKRRYLRIARHKISEEAYEKKTARQAISIIVFNEDFKIISEFPFLGGYHLDSIFFTPDGGIYARVNAQDECVLHFVRLAWRDVEDVASGNLTLKCPFSNPSVTQP